MRVNAMKVAAVMAMAAGGCVAAGETEQLPDEVEWRGRSYDRADLAGETEGRMTILHPNGGLYTSRQTVSEVVDVAPGAAGAIDRVARVVSDRPLVKRLAEVTADPTGTAERVIGSDGRALSPVGTSPHNAIARVDVYSNASSGGFIMSCTGAYIGPWTFVLAGHCLRPDSVRFAKRIVIEAERAGSSNPHHFDCRNGDVSTSNDFLAAVPAGYVGTRDNSNDIAVIDTFPCHSAPHAFLGYTVNDNTGTFAAHGYPLGFCPGAPAQGTYQCGMSGPAYWNEWRIETEHIDTTDGQDGMPWFTLNPLRVVGIDNGYREYFDLGRCGFNNCQRNYARRIDATADAFIRAIAFDF